ncbi:MAG TPA: hypothetical protein VK196_05085 [Magnetospirillum sp.]|nr:hypothetical protein [Magnetospirillum sp.]
MAKRDYAMPTNRPLAVYAFDPSRGRRAGNHMTVHVPYEPLQQGPVGRQIAVIDYDASNDCYYLPVDLDHPAVLLAGGLPPSEADPRFHQQMVYAVAMRTIDAFERALGRPLKWRRSSMRRDAPLRSSLRIFPHAFQQANAFYDHKLRALLFGYFRASAEEAGDIMPGQTVFTCLSHDIIVHETTHACLDGIRRYFADASTPDTAAFHEGFADIVALLQHFSVRDAVLETILRTGGQIHRPELDPTIVPASGARSIRAEATESNPLVELAKQFGEAMGHRRSLRSALGSPPDPARLATTSEPHDRGAILVAAVFDAYFTIYFNRTRDLMRIGRIGGAVASSGDLHPDLANRLCDEATRIATHVLGMCIRAVDYCPPVDIQLGEFLRAVITADHEVMPNDPHGYRDAFIRAFLSRGIVPEGVTSFSQDALLWNRPSQPLPPCRDLWFDLFGDGDRDGWGSHSQRQAKNAKILHAFATENAKLLGLDARLAIAVESYHPIHRVTPNGRLAVSFVVEFLQQRKLPYDEDDDNGPTFPFRGGSTVIFDHRGKVQFVITKSVNSAARAKRQRNFDDLAGYRSALAQFLPDDWRQAFHFAALHRGG